MYYDAFMFSDAIEMDTNRDGLISTSELTVGMSQSSVGMAAAAFGMTNLNIAEDYIEDGNTFEALLTIGDGLVGHEGWSDFTDGAQLVELLSRAGVLTEAEGIISSAGQDLVGLLVVEPVLSWMYTAAAADYYNTYMIAGYLMDQALEWWSAH